MAMLQEPLDKTSLKIHGPMWELNVVVMLVVGMYVALYLDKESLIILNLLILFPDLLQLAIKLNVKRLQRIP